MKREDFVELAGGPVFSDDFFCHWATADLQRCYWDFYESNDVEFMAYLQQNQKLEQPDRLQRLQVDQLIPRQFLRAYLLYKQADTAMIAGATVNPMNCFVVPKDWASQFRLWPYHCENNQVLQRYQFNLKYPFEGAELEALGWRFPSPTQGQLARSILYMALVYDISEFIPEHLTRLLNWARFDPPGLLEILHNRWVSENWRGHHNPLVSEDFLGNVLLLDDRELFDSLLTKTS